MNAEAEKPPRISRIWARNFKSIDHLELDLSPLTVLVGPNASGKSNIADIAKFVSDSVRDGLDSALMSRGQSALKHTTRRKNVTVGVEVESGDVYLGYEFSFQVTVDNGHRVRREILTLRSRESLGAEIACEIKDGKFIRPEDSVPVELVKGLTRDLELLAMPTLWTAVLGLETNGAASKISSGVVVPALRLLRDVRSYHIFPNVLRDPQPAGSKYQLNENGNNLASVLHEMKTKNSERWGEFLSAFKAMVPSIVGVDAKTAGSHLYLQFNHESQTAGKTEVLGASQESDGTLRLLGLLTALYQEPPPGLVIIEEPELAIHPGALPYVAELMEETTRLQTPILVTTHSPDFLDLVPVDSIRAVQMVNGGTTAAPVSEHQRAAAMKKLFTPGEIHRMEGLQPRSLAAS